MYDGKLCLFIDDVALEESIVFDFLVAALDSSLLVKRFLNISEQANNLVEWTIKLLRLYLKRLLRENYHMHNELPNNFSSIRHADVRDR